MSNMQRATRVINAWSFWACDAVSTETGSGHRRSGHPSGGSPLEEEERRGDAIRFELM